MRCRGCEYELWNMKPGGCPECGRQWRFEDFRFRPFSAQFLCPHCDHTYGGTDPQGLPIPRAFICAGCKQPIDLDQMRALPAPQTDGSRAMDDVHPWSERSRLGYWRSFWQTVGQSMSQPSQVGRTLPERTNLKSALFFSLLCSTIGIVFSTSPLLLLIGVGSLRGMSGIEYVLIFVAQLIGVVLGSAILGQILFLLWGSCSHAILRMGGDVRRPLLDTLSATLFCTGPFIISAVPCCGFYILWVSFIWMAVAMIYAFVTLHNVSGFRASVAVLLPILAVLVAAALTIGGAILMSNNSTWSSSGFKWNTTSTPNVSPNVLPNIPPSPSAVEQVDGESNAQVLPPLGPEAPEK